MIMPALCSWHDIGYPLLGLFGVILSPFPPHQSSNLLGKTDKLWVIIAKEQVGSLPQALDGCRKILSLVWKLCSRIEVYCGVVHIVYRSSGIVDLVFVSDLANKLHFIEVYFLWHVCYLYPLYHDSGSSIVSTCTMFDRPFWFPSIVLSCVILAIHAVSNLELTIIIQQVVVRNYHYSLCNNPEEFSF
jgi:hypothetical protein